MACSEQCAGALTNCHNINDTLWAFFNLISTEHDILIIVIAVLKS